MKIDRAILANNDQSLGMIADPNKLEDSINHLANVIDANDDEVTKKTGNHEGTWQNYTPVQLADGIVQQNLDSHINNTNNPHPNYAVESGSNANGNYTKFPNGTLLIAISRSIPGNGTLDYLGTWDYPIQVIEPVVGTVTGYNNYSALSINTMNQSLFASISTTQFRWGVKFNSGTGIPSGNSVSVNVLIWARWK